MANFGNVFNNSSVKKPEPHPKRETKWIHYTKMIDNAAQYCDEKDEEEIQALASLIKADKGVLQNLLVRKVDSDEYEIIAGHKRRRACRWLVEEEGEKQYEFLPCTVEHISDIQAEFQVYSSNSHHEKTDYEKMHELERMKYLLETYPEEFPHLQTGRMVERLAKKMNMKKTTVGEYLTIANNLGEKGMEAFKSGDLKKSAAVELSALPKEEQEELIEQGMTSHKEVKAYKEEKEKREQQNIEAEPQFPGQLEIFNIDMEVAEDIQDAPGDVPDDVENVPDFGTQTTEEGLSAYGTVKKVYPPESMIASSGCEGGHDCFLCHVSCQIRQEECYCVEAPMGNPFPCTTLKVIENIKKDVGEICQFVNLELAERRADNEPVPCCKKCTVEECTYRCDRAEIQEKLASPYTPEYFLQEQKQRLDDMCKAKNNGETVPEKAIERQRVIVTALGAMVSGTEQTGIKEETDQTIQPELPELKNNEQRKAWLRNYKAWGVWYCDDNIGAIYYKYDFPDGTRLIAETYGEDKYGYSPSFLHLVGGPDKRMLNQYGLPKYPYHEKYNKYPDSDTELIEFLKAIQKH